MGVRCESRGGRYGGRLGRRCTIEDTLFNNIQAPVRHWPSGHPPLGEVLYPPLGIFSIALKNGKPTFSSKQHLSPGSSFLNAANIVHHMQTSARAHLLSGFL